MPDADELIAAIRALGSQRNREGMGRFGINVDNAAGVSMRDLRALAKGIPRDHALAAALWRSGLHEARILAALLDDPAKVTPAQMDRWVRAFDSWDLCDQVCANLFDRTPYAWDKAAEWSHREPEFEKRAAFALWAALAVHDKKAPDERFDAVFEAVEREAHDDRNFVRKAVNWALRQTGKRNPALRRRAIAVAKRLSKHDERAARWIGTHALRELQK